MIEVLNLSQVDASERIALEFGDFQTSLEAGKFNFYCRALGAKSFTGDVNPSVSLIPEFATDSDSDSSDDEDYAI